MELQYLYIEDAIRIGKKKEICFTGENVFKIKDYKKESRKITIKIENNHNHISNFFESNITNISAIIGENGTGKTTFLDFLKQILTTNQYKKDKWLAIFKDKKTFKIFHTFFDWSNSEKSYLKNEWSIKIIYKRKNIKPILLFPYGIDRYSIRIKDIPFLKETKIIHYSGIFDLRDYPYGNKLPYIDISTNFLLENDAKKEEYTLPNISPLLKHKHKNIRRQFELVQLNSQLLKKIDFKTPESISIIFNTIEVDVNSRDFTNRNKEILKYFKERINKELINESIIKKELQTSNFRYKKALRIRSKLKFAQSLILNFFSNLDHGDNYDYELDVDISNYESLDIIDATFDFFKNQEYIKSDIIIMLMNSAFSIIENPKSIIDNSSENIIDTSNYTSTIELLSNYEQYFKNIPFSTKNGFIDLNWRELSSGEKAFLDLYSRLLWAKQTIIKKDVSVKFIYLLLDEAEIGYHPEWQRKYLDNLINFVNNLFFGLNNLKIQIFIASHSPFLVSDFPKSNITFLKRSENELFNVVSLNREQTFGANIHTLFSDSFFLEEGLIGEFAKSKINEVINIITDKKTDKKEYAKKIISIIGDSLIKNRLNDMYQDAFEQRNFETNAEYLNWLQEETERVKLNIEDNE